MNLAGWEALDARQQVAWWLLVPDEARTDFLGRAAPVARLVLAAPLRFNGDHASNRVAMKNALRPSGFAVGNDDDEWLTQHSRMMTLVENARKHWAQGMADVVREEWPASKLVSPGGRVPAGTRERWLSVGGKIVGGKMMALKTDTVWSRFNVFGRPHAPFDLAGKLDVEDVDFAAAAPLLR